MKRFRSVLISLGMLGWLIPVQSAPSRPNIVLMLVDDLGIMDTSVRFLTGPDGQPKSFDLNTFYRTPNLQRLADRGVRFNQFCAMSVCSPTRVSIMTGQNSARHRVTNWINPATNNAGPRGPTDWRWEGLSKNDITLPRVLKNLGYRTIHVGKGHFGPSGSEGADPRNIGFDLNVGGTSAGQPPSYYGLQSFASVKAQGKGKPSLPGLDAYHGKEVFLTEALTQEANRLVEDAVLSDQPFFLYFAQYGVHAPFNADPRFSEHYKDSGKSPSAQAFATLVEGVDKSLGDVWRKIEALGVANDTLLIFLGDNGSDAPLGDPHAVACAAPLRGKKGSHYEGGMRVPFVAAWGADGGRFAESFPIGKAVVQKQLGAVYDIFPTLVRVAGGESPLGHVVDGSSLWTLMQGSRDPDRNESFLMHYPHAPHRTDYFTSLRHGRWKLIYHYFPTIVSGGSHYQLFDLQEDPFEQLDKTGSEPTVLRRMVSTMRDELLRQRAQMPLAIGGLDPVSIQLPD